MLTLSTMTPPCTLSASLPFVDIRTDSSPPCMREAFPDSCEVSMYKFSISVSIEVRCGLRCCYAHHSSLSKMLPSPVFPPGQIRRLPRRWVRPHPSPSPQDCSLRCPWILSEGKQFHRPRIPLPQRRPQEQAPKCRRLSHCDLGK